MGDEFVKKSPRNEKELQNFRFKLEANLKTIEEDLQSKFEDNSTITTNFEPELLDIAIAFIGFLFE